MRVYTETKSVRPYLEWACRSVYSWYQKHEGRNSCGVYHQHMGILRDLENCVIVDLKLVWRVKGDRMPVWNRLNVIWILYQFWSHKPVEIFLIYFYHLLVIFGQDLVWLWDIVIDSLVDIFHKWVHRQSLLCWSLVVGRQRKWSSDEI